MPRTRLLLTFHTPTRGQCSVTLLIAAPPPPPPAASSPPLPGQVPPLLDSQHPAPLLCHSGLSAVPLLTPRGSAPQHLRSHSTSMPGFQSHHIQNGKSLPGLPLLSFPGFIFSLAFATTTKAAHFTSQTGFPLFCLPAPRAVPGTCGYPVNVYNPRNWHTQAGNEPILAGPQVACLPWTGAVRGGQVSARSAKSCERVKRVSAVLWESAQIGQIRAP